MRIEVVVKQEVEVGAIRCVLPVRYDEEDMANDAPFRKGDIWEVTIDANTGVIRDWPKGKTLSFSMKVCDMGSYYLLDENGDELANIDEDYVPYCIPQRYGDYVDFNIDSNGRIAERKSHCHKGSVEESFFGDDE